MSRPSLFTAELADKLLEGIADGKSMRQLCAADDMPNRSTVIRWQNENEGFAASIARAREMQADYMDDLILETANACTNETAQADRVRIYAYQWRASKLRPKVYGDKIETTLAGRVTVAREMTDDDLASIAAGGS